MMLPTHILAGGSLGLLLSFTAPEMRFTLIIAGMLAAVLPDLDMFFEHRKTLHRPIEFFLMLIVVSSIFMITGSPLFLILSVILGSVNLHVAYEIFGNGKTMNTELKHDDRCVYDHWNGEWIKPLMIITTGSSKDLALAVVSSLPLLLYQKGSVLTITLVVLSLGFTQFILTD